MYTSFVEDRAIRLISFLGFVFGVSTSLLAYVCSSYFKEVISSDNVSFFYLPIFCILLFALFSLNRIIEGFGRARTLMAFLAAQIGVLFALQFMPTSWMGAIFLIVYLILNGVISIVFDIVLEAYSHNGHTGRLRGMYLSVWNFGILVGPMISTFLMEQYGFFLIFAATLLLYILMFLTVFIALNDIQGHVIAQHLRPRRTFRKFFQKKELLHIYWISLALHFFYAAMTVYMPLYLRDIGLSWGDIGLIFTIMLIPFIVVQYPAGLLADKWYGEKEMLLIGLSIMIISVIIMFFTHMTSFAFWTLILFISRVGAAFVEAMQDSYFYKQINENDIALINFFRSTRAVAYIISTILIGISLMFFDDMKNFFLITFLVLISGYIPIIILRDSMPVKECKSSSIPVGEL